MNKQKFVAELSRLLGFMSSWDRQAVIEKYSAMFDAAEDENALIEELISPTRLAIRLAGEYVPTSPPVSESAGDAQTAPEAEDEGSEAEEEAPALEAASEAPEASEAACAEECLTQAEEAREEAVPPAKRRKARVAVLIFYIPLALIIGVPVAIALIAIGVPFLVSGAALSAAAVFGGLELIGLMAMFSDILMIGGVAIVLAAIGLLLAWLGLWLSLELGYLWIGKLIFGLGSKICFKKEVPTE